MVEQKASAYKNVFQATPLREEIESSIKKLKRDIYQTVIQLEDATGNSQEEDQL